MTINEAIYQLGDLIKDAETHRDENGELDDVFQNDIEALTMGIKALEKQVPIRIPDVGSSTEVKAFDGKDKVCSYKCVSCPSCGKWIVVNINHKYCEYCGQALDWDKEKS